MQAIKEKISDMKEMRRAKSEAREEEKAEKELAKARMQVAHEVRLAKEAEAAMDLHVEKAAEKAVHQEEKLSFHNTGQQYGAATKNPYDNNSSSAAGYSSHQAVGGGVQDLSDSSRRHIAPDNSTTGTGYADAPSADNKKYM